MQATTIRPIWREAPGHLRLSAGQVHLWRFDLATAPIAACRQLLAAEELQQAARLVSLHLRRQRIAGRGLLRVTLSRYLGLPPEKLRFCTGPYGKPALDPPVLHFNLSHSGETMLIAVAIHFAVGIDLEQFRPDCAWETVARSCCSPQELAQLQRLPPEQRQAAFYACWTGKEAFAKALGLGLALPLRTLAIPLQPEILLRTDDGRFWMLRRLDLGQGYAAALVANTHQFQLRCWAGQL